MFSSHLKCVILSSVRLVLFIPVCKKTHGDTHKPAVEPSLTCSEEMKRASVGELNL